MLVEMNLWNDYIALLRNDLNNSGFSTAAMSDEEVFIGFFNWQKRKVRVAKRGIHKSKQFVCPAEFRGVLGRISKRIAAGKDVTPYLSKDIRKLGCQDMMLNDWGIHHLHLGDKIDKRGFIARTDALLFVKFTAHAAYFVNIYQHGDWNSQDIVQVIHSNWPKLIVRHRIHVDGLSHIASNEDIKALRKAHINTLLQLKDGTVYAPIGGGYASDGTSNDIALGLVQTRRRLRTAENEIRKDINQNPARFAGTVTMRFRGEFNGVSFRAIDETNRFAYKIW